MEFIETTVFSRRADELLGPEEIRALQLALAAQPSLGVLIPGLRGVRKLRWAAAARGKQGGVRIVYFWAVSRDLILLLQVFAKNEQPDLRPEQKRVLLAIVRREFG